MAGFRLSVMFIMNLYWLMITRTVGRSSACRNYALAYDVVAAALSSRAITVNDA